VIAYRGEYGFCMAHLERRFYNTDRYAKLLFLAARPNPIREGVKLFLAVVGSAFDAGAVEVSFTEETGVKFSALAKRLGATKETPVYTLRRGAQDGSQEEPSG
jgi:hypothetical protein